MQLFMIYFLIFCSLVAPNVKGLLFTYSSVWLMALEYTFSGFYFAFLNKGRKD